LWSQQAFQIHGFIQGRFTNQEGTPDRLEVRRLRLILSGDPVSKLSYRFQVDFAKKPYLMDASLAWRFSREATFTAGQFKIPFSAESIIADNLNAPISRSRAVLSLAPGRDTGVQGRDTGTQLSGSLMGGKESLVDYAAGVFRGQTLIESPKIHYNAAAGRAMVHPIRGLTAGADWYQSFSAPAGAAKRREELEGGFERGPLQVRAEQIWAQDGTLHRRGGYLLGAWRFAKTWQGLTRADWLTTNAQKPDTTSIAYIAGVNYLFRNYVKVGFNSGAQHDQGPKGFSSALLAQVMLGF
jgi:hypothetical protein